MNKAEYDSIVTCKETEGERGSAKVPVGVDRSNFLKKCRLYSVDYSGSLYRQGIGSKRKGKNLKVVRAEDLESTVLRIHTASGKHLNSKDTLEEFRKQGLYATNDQIMETLFALCKDCWPEWYSRIADGESFSPLQEEDRVEIRTRLDLKCPHGTHHWPSESQFSLIISTPNIVHGINNLDSNCFARCLAFVTTGCEELHETIRVRVFEHLQLIRAELAAVSGVKESNIEKMTRESNLDKGASSEEFAAAASFLGVDIIVWNGVPGCRNKSAWYLYPADIKSIKRTPRAIYLKCILEGYDVHVDVVLSTA